ncbi:hypothetical protein XELAEV_18016825mg [Xenopus laevis]|uniref:Uncharacterized protein n=1 Tax=Xenopus laevis TaxID=8355 RepID=A0A974DA25_XENLA|nr:hypothetical protein XELAEV_18016825mg [Xenopus laevis]
MKEQEKEIDIKDSIKEKESQQVPMEAEKKPEDKLQKKDKQSHNEECEKEKEQFTIDKVKKAEEEEEKKICETKTGDKKRISFFKFGKNRKKDRCSGKNVKRGSLWTEHKRGQIVPL